MARSTYFDLDRSAEACPGSESGYAQRFQCRNIVKRRIWTRMIFEVDRRQGRFLRVAYVDGRLVMPILAGCKLWFQVTPMTRPTCVPVIPGVPREMFLGGTTHRQDKRYI